MDVAAVKIQTKYRQHRAKSRVSLMREERRAAVKIQSGYRGYKARQSVQRMRYIRTLSFKYELHERDKNKLHRRLIACLGGSVG